MLRKKILAIFFKNSDVCYGIYGGEKGLNFISNKSHPSSLLILRKHK